MLSIYHPGNPKQWWYTIIITAIPWIDWNNSFEKELFWERVFSDICLIEQEKFSRYSLRLCPYILKAAYQSFDTLLLYWSIAGSNRWPLQCHWSALPTELIPRSVCFWCPLVRTGEVYTMEERSSSKNCKKVQFFSIFCVWRGIFAGFCCEMGQKGHSAGKEWGRRLGGGVVSRWGCGACERWK